MKRRRIAAGAPVLAFMLLLAVAVSWNIQTNELIFLPALAEAIDRHVTVAGHPLRPHRGSSIVPLWCRHRCARQAN